MSSSASVEAWEIGNVYADFIVNNRWLYEFGKNKINDVDKSASLSVVDTGGYIREYVTSFSEMLKKRFFTYYTMNVYKSDILDQWKKQLVFTGHNIGQSGTISLLSLFQLSPEKHLTCHYTVEDKQMVVRFEVITTNAIDYVNFIDDNKKFIFKPRELNGGFSPHAGVGFK